MDGNRVRVPKKQYIGYVSDANVATARANAGAVSHNFANLFATPCYTEEGDTPTHWCTLTPPMDDRQRELLGAALGGLGIVHDEYEARRTRFDDDLDLFLAAAQLRRREYVSAHGLFKADGTADPQTATTTAALISQWTAFAKDLNTTNVGGASNPRIELTYGGTYEFEADLNFVGTYTFRLTKNLGYASGPFEATNGPKRNIEVTGLLAADRLGVSVQVAAGSAEFKLLGGSYFGLKRIGQ